MIIGMDQLENYKVVLNLFDKIFTYVAEDKTVRKVNGFSKPVSLRQMSSFAIKELLQEGL